MTPLCISAWVAVLIVLPVLILLWVTESKPQRIRRFHRQYGWSQRRIAEHVDITRWQVRTALAGGAA
jgi:hypothetical protein